MNTLGATKRTTIDKVARSEHDKYISTYDRERDKYRGEMRLRQRRCRNNRCGLAYDVPAGSENTVWITVAATQYKPSTPPRAENKS